MGRRSKHLAPLVAAALLVPLAGCTTGPDGAIDAPKTLDVASPTVGPDAPVPRQHTCDGANRSPQVDVTGLPSGTRSLALIMDDPGAPRGTFVHWVVWNVPVGGPSVTFPEGSAPAGAEEGENGAGTVGYNGPCPPSGGGAHHYHFKAYAVDSELTLPGSATKQELVDALDGRVLAWGELVTTYSR